jgi:hypothetical protein
MPDEQSSPQQLQEPKIYVIRIQGHLGSEWEEYFGGMTVRQEDNGDTLLTGPIVDQAALYGLLSRLRDLGLCLQSINCLDTDQAERN